MSQKLTLLLAFAGLLSLSSLAQLTGYQQEGFENTTFPPTGWTSQSIQGANVWSRNTSEYHSGVASAYISYQSTTGQDWLITPHYTVTAATDSIVFWMKLDYQGYQPDSLAIKVSTTDNQTTSFTTTLRKLQEGVNYPPDDDNWYRYAVSLENYVGQNIYLAFKHYNADGDGLYIDDVAIGTKPPYDASTIAATTATPSVVNQVNSVTATVSNSGNFTETFNVTAEINPGGYTSTQTVTGLAPGATAPVIFTGWTPSATGSYTLKVYTQLASDLDHDDDTLEVTRTVYDAFPHYGWESATPLPAGRWAHAQVFTDLCVEDTAFLYVISGNDAGFAAISSVLRQNLVTGAWQTRAAIPAARHQVGAAEIGGKIYVPGGYAGSFSPNATLHIYDIATDTWTTGAPMPTAVGDYAIDTYGDSLIYVIGGYNGASDVTTVQIYHVATNTWTLGTSHAGIATSGGRMGISGGTILYAGGYSQATGATQVQAQKGIIDPVNPGTITWTAAPAMPLGPQGRLGGGAGLTDGRIYFTAGDPNGEGTLVSAQTFAFNTLTDSWEVGPDKLTAVSNIMQFTPGIYNDSLYFFSAGGYNGTTIVTVNERLNLGPYISPGASGDSVFCDGGTLELSAWGGKTYSWTSATAVSDPSAASPTATVTQTETFDVTITPRYGCPVTATVTATVNFSATSSQTVEVCYGETLTVGDSTYAASGVYTNILSTINGCDSTVTTNLTVLPENTYTQTITICDGESLQVGANTYTGSGIYTDVLPSAAGCDSTVTTNLTVLPPNAVTQNVSICSGESYQVGSSTYTATGTYTDVLTAAAGCDSTVTTHLTVEAPIDVTTSTVNNVITATATGATYEWYDCSSGNAVPGETSQSFAPSENGLYGVYVTVNGCTESSACVAITTIGIDELHVLLPQIFPNPNNGSFTVKALEEGSFLLLNELGQVVERFELQATNGFSATFSGLDSGIYFVTRTDLRGGHSKVVVTQ